MLLEAVLKVRDMRIESFFGKLHPTLRDHGLAKKPTLTEKHLEKTVQTHVMEQLPRFMQSHVKLLSLPADLDSQRRKSGRSCSKLSLTLLACTK